MALESSIPVDNRLDETPMMPVVCDNCGARVLARKSTWNQTSVQWNADATARCAERAEAQKMSAHASRGVFLVCSALGAVSYTHLIILPISCVVASGRTAAPGR